MTRTSSNSTLRLWETRRVGPSGSISTGPTSRPAPPMRTILMLVEVLSDGRILISTTGSTSVTGATTGDEDLLLFTPTSLGDLNSRVASRFLRRLVTSDSWIPPRTSTPRPLTLTGTFTCRRLGPSRCLALAARTKTCSSSRRPALEPPTTTGSFASTLYFDGSTFGLDMNNVFVVDVPG